MIPWFPGGHCDPWNHVETAMALDVAGRRAEAERGLRLAGRHASAPTASWHQYYLADGVEEDQARHQRRAPTSPPACGTTGCCTGDRGFVEATVADRRARPSTSCSTCRRRAARSSGRATPTARRGPSPCSPARRRSATACAARSRSPSTLGDERPDWELVRRPPAPTSSRTQPDAFEPKDRWAMDWYYPVLAGVVTGDAGRARGSPSGWDTFVMEGTGVRCVSDDPWVTAAETGECALAHLAVGERDTRRSTCSRWAAAAPRATTAATGPASSTPTRSASPAASARPTPPRRSSSPPTRSPAAAPASGAVRRPRPCSPR